MCVEDANELLMNEICKLRNSHDNNNNNVSCISVWKIEKFEFSHSNQRRSMRDRFATAHAACVLMMLKASSIQLKLNTLGFVLKKKTLAFIFLLLLFVCQRATQSKDVDIKAKICVVCFFGHANIAVEISSEIVHIHTIYPPCVSLSLPVYRYGSGIVYVEIENIKSRIVCALSEQQQSQES